MHKHTAKKKEMKLRPNHFLTLLVANGWVLFTVLLLLVLYEVKVKFHKKGESKEVIERGWQRKHQQTRDAKYVKINSFDIFCNWVFLCFSVFFCVFFWKGEKMELKRKLKKKSWCWHLIRWQDIKCSFAVLLLWLLILLISFVIYLWHNINVTWNCLWMRKELQKVIWCHWLWLKWDGRVIVEPLA